MGRPRKSTKLEIERFKLEGEIENIPANAKNTAAIIGLRIALASLDAQIEILSRIEDRGW